jgi:hypothetical protein
MKKFTSPLVILSAATLFVVVPGATAVHAQCTTDTLTGSYAMIWQDFTTEKALQGNEVPWAGTAVVTFNGVGNTTASYTTAVDGTFYPAQAGAGPYTVNPDCSGTWSLTSGDASGFTSNLVIASGGAEVFGAATNTSDTVAFDLVKLVLATLDEPRAALTASISGTQQPTVSLSPKGIWFWYYPRCFISTNPVTVTLTNNGPGMLDISGIVISGGPRFSQTHTCGSTLGVGDSCSISVTWERTPGVGSLVITDNGVGSPQTVALRGSFQCLK